MGGAVLLHLLKILPPPHRPPAASLRFDGFGPSCISYRRVLPTNRSVKPPLRFLQRFNVRLRTTDGSHQLIRKVSDGVLFACACHVDLQLCLIA